MTDISFLTNYLEQRYGKRFSNAYLWCQDNKGRISELTVEKGEVPSISASVKGDTGTYPVYIGPEGFWCRCQSMTSTKSPCKHVFSLLLYCYTEGLINEEETYNLIGRWE